MAELALQAHYNKETANSQIVDFGLCPAFGRISLSVDRVLPWPTSSRVCEGLIVLEKTKLSNRRLSTWLRPLSIGLLICLVPLLVAAAPAPRPAALGNERLVLAFYYNWFDENTWRGNKVPDLPVAPYVSRDRAVMGRHIDEAKGAGIDAFVVSWYGPRTENNQTETNFRAMLDEAAARGFRLAVDFETAGPFFGGTQDVIAALRTLLATHANHPAYLRVDGRPVIFFWRQQRFSVGTWQAIRDQVDPNHQAIWIAEGVDIQFQQVFDGHHLYSVAWSADPGSQLVKWGQRVRQASQKWGRKLWVATVMPGYNDTRTGRSNAFIRARDDGAYYGRTWSGALASGADWVIVTSWNEWPEGTYIEPSQAFGGRYLDLTREWVARYKAGEGAPPAAPTAVAPPPPPAPTPTPVPTPSSPQLSVQTAILNVRLGPGTVYRVLDQVRAGQVLAITGKTAQADWWQVCCVAPQRSGWVAGHLVRAAGPLSQVAVVEPPPLPRSGRERNIDIGVE